MKTSRPSSSSSAFTLIELLTVIAIIGILAAILIPTVGKVRESARASQSVSNIRQLNLAAQLYANDYGFFPGTNPNGDANNHFWGHDMQSYVEPVESFGESNGNSIWFAPNLLTRHSQVSNPNLTSYGMNAWLYRAAGSGARARVSPDTVPNASRKTMVMESLWVAGGFFDAEPTAYRFQAWRGQSPGNEQDLNVGFVDGHVERLKIDDLLRDGDNSDYWGVMVYGQ